MQFDSYTVAFLIRPTNAPELDEAAADALQDRHLDHLARLHEAGALLAAGPLLGEPEEPIRGICIFGVEAAEAEALLARDPAVGAGRLTVKVLRWMVPAGAFSFSPARFPHSLAEADG